MRGRAAVARRAHNPKVAGSIPALATVENPSHKRRVFYFCYVHNIYILYSQKFDKKYIGFAANMEQRIRSHNLLSTNGYTLRFRPWIIMHQEEFETKKEAMQREKYLNKGVGRELINEIKKLFIK